MKSKNAENVQVVKRKTSIHITEIMKHEQVRDFPGATVVKNPPANAGDTGSIPGPGRSHMPLSN